VTPKTITDRRVLRAELDLVRKRGWANVPDEGMIGFNAVAAPISDARANLVAMIGVIGATRLLPAAPRRVSSSACEALDHKSPRRWAGLMRYPD
jgi:DNA-binding IclR family transcriptional regulator